MKNKFVILLTLLISSQSFGKADIKDSEAPIILSKDNVIVLNEVVTAESVAKIMVDVRKIDSRIYGSSKPIYLFLNTPGGSVTDGLNLIDFLNGLRRPVYTITAFAASMGFQIAQNLQERYILPHGTLMSHRARGGIEGEFGGVSPNQMESRFKFWSNVVTQLDKQTVSRTKGKQTLESYEKLYVPELWLTSEKAVELGFADKIVVARCDDSLSGTEEHQATFMGMPITYLTDKCPINTGIFGISAKIKTNRGLMTMESFTNAGGSFSPECLTLAANDPYRVCSVDTTLSVEKINAIATAFVTSYSETKSNIKPLQYIQ